MTPAVVRFGEGEVPSLVVVGTSVLNALAFDPWQLWAFLRAELTAYAETPFRCPNGALATMAPVRTLHPQSAGVERLVPIARHLIDQLLPLLNTAPRELRVALMLCLPSRMADGAPRGFTAQRRILEHELTAYLASVQEGRGGPAPLVRVIPRGHAAMAFALQEVAGALVGGSVDAVLLGGLDTGYDPACVDALAERGRLFDGENLEAAIPAEGGAFVALTTHETAGACRWPRLAEIKAAVTAQEVATIDNDVPLMGLALSRSVLEATARLEAQRRSLDWWITDMTAEPLRVQEFQLAWPRGATPTMLPGSALEFMAARLGDLGAAVMPTAVALAVEGFARGAPRAETCLVTGSSEGGERGVVLVERG